MSAMVPANRQKPRAMVFVPGHVAATGVVDVYQHPNGRSVVVVANSTIVKQTPHGQMRIRGGGAVEFPSKLAYNEAKRKAFLKNPELYAMAVGALGIDDNVDNAPMLPDHLLSSFSDTSKLLAQSDMTKDSSVPLLSQFADDSSNDAEVMVAGVESMRCSPRIEREHETMADLLMPGHKR